MTTQEFATIREQLGMSDEALASKLGVTTRLIKKWGEGRVAIGEGFVLALQSLVYTAQSDALLATSGLPQCPVVEKGLTRVRNGGETLSTDELLNLQRHLRSCPVCKARERFVADRLGEVPAPAPPTSMIARIFLWAGTKIGLLPEWARPAAGGAAFLFVIVVGRMVFALPLMLLSGAPSVRLLPIFGGPFVAALGGAAGGLGYTFLGKPLRRVPVIGPYLAGIVTVGAYMVSLELVFRALGAPMISDKSDMVAFAVVTVFFGLVAGKMWFASDDNKGLVPRSAV